MSAGSESPTLSIYHTLDVVQDFFAASTYVRIKSISFSNAQASITDITIEDQSANILFVVRATNEDSQRNREIGPFTTTDGLKITSSVLSVNIHCTVTYFKD